jgi:tetratricopeptide (TPR) repeat protein
LALIELEMTYIEAVESEAIRYESAGQRDQAIEKYQAGLEKCQKGLSLAQRLQRKDSMRYFSKAIGLMTALGTLYSKQEQYTAAADYYRRAAELSQGIRDVANATTFRMYAHM